MRQRFVLCAIVIGAAGLTAGCPPAQDLPDAGDAGDFEEPGRADGGTAYGFCPTRIDVYGANAAVLEGCGGIEAELSPAGTFAPGDAGYEATLAGRLRQRLLADPEVVARFGEAFTVRSCARRGTMGSYVRQVPAAECANGGNTGDSESVCTDAPAPLVLFDATNVHDRCHGGGPDSAYEDDLEGFAEHWRARFDQFLTAKAPGFLMVSPQLDWLPASSSIRRECGGARSSWNSAGALRWRSQNPTAQNVRRIPVLQDEFERHHPCCGSRGAPCEESWYTPDAGSGADGWTTFDCRGADAVVEHWYAELRGYLLSNQFDCDG